MGLGIWDGEKLCAEIVITSRAASPIIQYNNGLHQIRVLSRATNVVETGSPIAR